MDYSTNNCPFCYLDPKIELISENEFAFAVYDIYPVNKGHVLVITKRHVSDYFETTSEERLAILDLLDEMKIKLESDLQPDGFNIGINIDEAAGQTIPHVHVHLIPRFEGDMENPRGGVRHVIPSKGNY